MSVWLRSRPHRCLLQLRSLPGRPRARAAQPTITAAAPPPQKPKDLRTLLLHVAHRGDGKLTVTQAVMETGMDWKPIERCLRKMVRAGYVDVDNEPDSGVVVYVFPELVGRPAAGRRRAPHGRRSGSRACIDSSLERCIYNFDSRRLYRHTRLALPDRAGWTHKKGRETAYG